MTRIHHGSGFDCTYPENWQLAEDTDDGSVVGFTLQSPNTAFMSVYYRPTAMATPDELLDEMTALLESEYEEVERSPLGPDAIPESFPIEDWDGVELSFYYLDLIITARLLAFSMGERSILVHCQAEDREFQQIERVFQAMLLSMLASKKEKTSPNLG